MGIGAVVHVLIKFMHPSQNIRDKYPNPEKGTRLEGCVVTGKCLKVVSRQEQTVITFHNDEFDGVELYAVERYCLISEEGPAESFFSTHYISVEAEPVDDNSPVDEVENATQQLNELTQRNDALRLGREIQFDAEMMNSGIAVGKNNHPIPSPTLACSSLNSSS